jgi:hypothetical protein
LEIVYGVEMDIDQERQPGFFAQLIKQIPNTATIIDRDEELFIVQSKEEALQLQQLFETNGIFEESYVLYKLNHPQRNKDWHDYGFQSANEQVIYLYREITAPFTITNGSNEQIKMALLQIDEHLVMIDQNDDEIYFVDRQQKDLITGIAKAYDIEVSFFELDKH